MLVLLAGLSACATHPPAPVVERSTQPARAEIPVDGLHRVHSGDTLFGIAFKYGLDHRDLARWNRIAAPYTIFPDQVIRLRAPAHTAARANDEAVATAGVRQPRAATRRNEPATRPAPEKPAPARPAPPQKQPAPAPKSSTPSPPQATGGSGRWAWPTSGGVLRSFKAGDPTRNGIDIRSSAGAPVLAAAGGQVVYSGNGLIGYGELVIVKHDERMLSAYAHNSRRLVAEGDTVRQGQKIAEVGRNGQNETVLHFEIRRDGKPVDPLRYLPPR